MILRLRGDLHTEAEFPFHTPPVPHSLIVHEGVWYEVTEQAWWLMRKSDGALGWDVACAVRVANVPEWARKKVS